jgi:hypothetical protein
MSIFDRVFGGREAPTGDRWPTDRVSLRPHRRMEGSLKCS